MDIRNKVFWLRLSFWAGAIVDGIAAVQMLLPGFRASFNGLSIPVTGHETGFALGAGALLMSGWTILLIWGDRRPLERKGILLITVFPVVIGLMLNNVVSITSGLRTFGSALPILLVQSALVVLFIFSYWNASGGEGGGA